MFEGGKGLLPSLQSNKRTVRKGKGNTMLQVSPKFLKDTTESRARELVTNIMKALDNKSKDEAFLKGVIKDYIYTGFRNIEQDVKNFNEGLYIKFNSQG